MTTTKICRVDFGENENKAKSLFNKLVIDPSRQAMLFHFLLGEKSLGWSVYYRTRR